VDRHAGFAAALNLRGQMLQDMQRIAYHAGKIPHRLNGSLEGTSADLFLDLPRLEFRKADQTRVRLHIRAWGPLTVTPNGGPAETRSVVLQATFLVTILAGVSTPADAPPQVTLALQDFLPEIVAMSVVPFAGGPYSPEAQAFLNGGTFRLGIQALVGQRLSSITPSGFDAGFLGGIARTVSGGLSTRVLDGMLAIGIDVFVAEEDLELATNGDPNLLTDFSEGNDIAVSINRRAVALAFEGVTKEIGKKVEDEGAELDFFSFSVDEGFFRMNGKATATEGSVTFSMKAVPQLTRPGYSREYDELWFDMRDIDVDVSLNWWAAALASLGSIVTLGFGAIVVKGLMDMKRGSVTADIARKDLERQAARVQEFTLAGTTEPVIRLTLERFECHDEDVLILSTLRPQFKGPRVAGDRAISADEALTRNAFYYLRLPFDALPDDPQLFVRWTVRRSDTNEILYISEGQIQFRQGLGLNNSFIPFLETPKFTIECRVYRALGADIQDLLNDTLTLAIVDRLDRSHPFVRWSHEVWAPQVKVESNGSQTVLGFAPRGRRSKLHRTALPGRCREVSSFSLNQIRDAGPGVTPSVIEYLDELPFPVEDLAKNRKKVCEYCFFGGPTKTEPVFP
jgi:hypothetical protein